MVLDLAACMLVFAGGFLGGILRFAISGIVARRIGETFPWGTLVVNVTGDMVIGGLAGAAATAGGALATAAFREFAVVGILGGYTTVSSFALQTLSLAVDGERLHAALNVVVSTALGVAAVGIGFVLSAQLLA